LSDKLKEQEVQMGLHSSAGPLRCVLHGSFRKHLSEIGETLKLFQSAGIEVLEPVTTEVVAEVNDFLYLRGQMGLDPRLIEADYLSKVLSLRDSGFSYFVNPGGYLGPSASHELGIVMARGIPFYLSETPVGHCFFVPRARVVKPTALVEQLLATGELPQVTLYSDEAAIAEVWSRLLAT
jgi:hypothetical protein